MRPPVRAHAGSGCIGEERSRARVSRGRFRLALALRPPPTTMLKPLYSTHGGHSDHHHHPLHPSSSSLALIPIIAASSPNSINAVQLSLSSSDIKPHHKSAFVGAPRPSESRGKRPPDFLGSCPQLTSLLSCQERRVRVSISLQGTVPADQSPSSSPSFAVLLRAMHAM